MVIISWDLCYDMELPPDRVLSKRDACELEPHRRVPLCASDA